jgi:hypothetical protein
MDRHRGRVFDHFDALDISAFFASIQDLTFPLN